MGSKTTKRFQLVRATSCRFNVDEGSFPLDRSMIVKWDDWRSGADNPKYKATIRSGGNATNALEGVSATVTETQAGHCTLEILRGNARGSTGTSTWMGLWPVSPGDNYIAPSYLLAAEAEAALKIRQKIRSQIQAMSGLTFLGELRESVRMIKRPALGIENALRKFIGSNNPRAWNKRNAHLSRRAAKTTYKRDLADSWLELSFGVQPLISDISTIATELLPSLNVEDVHRVRSTANKVEPPTFDYGQDSDMECVIYQTRTRTASCDVNFEAGVRRKIQCDGTNALMALADRSFRLDDIVPTAWELLPWSFFIDYFSNIGDVISANYLSMNDVAWSFKTTRTQTVRAVRATRAVVYAPTFYKVKEFVPRELQTKTSWVKREVSSIPYATVRFELPSSGKQFTNMLALLVSQTSHH